MSRQQRQGAIGRLFHDATEQASHQMRLAAAAGTMQKERIEGTPPSLRAKALGEAQWRPVPSDFPAAKSTGLASAFARFHGLAGRRKRPIKATAILPKKEALDKSKDRRKLLLQKEMRLEMEQGVSE